jgi:PST family polysaccharide transporter
MPEAWLPADHGTEQTGLRRKVARGLTWTMLHTWGGQFLSLIVFLVLARLLTPDQFGLVALAAVFVAFAQLIVDQGFGDAIIQRPGVTRAHLDTAFWVAVVTGAATSLAGILLAGWIADLLKQPALAPILRVLSLAFMVSALSSTQMAILRRELAFRSLALRGLAALFGGGVVGVVMAFMGFGAWALVGQQVASTVISAIALWRVSPWRPGFNVSWPIFRELFGFGINVVGSDTLIFLSRNTDNLLIGVFLGPTPLGIYAVAYRILDTTQKVLVGVAMRLAFPSLARLQAEPDRMRRAYLNMTRIGGSVILPGYIGFALVAPEMIVFLFGHRWVESGPVASILFLIGPVLSLQAFSTSLLTAAGFPSVVFRFRLVTTITNVVGFLIGVQFGIQAVALAFAIRGYILLPWNLSLQRRYADIPIREYLGQLRGTASATAAMCVVVLGLKLLVGPLMSTTALLAVEVAAGAVTFFVVLWLVDRALLREMLRIARQTVPGVRRIRQWREGRVAEAVDEPLVPPVRSGD